MEKTLKSGTFTEKMKKEISRLAARERFESLIICVLEATGGKLGVKS